MIRSSMPSPLTSPAPRPRRRLVVSVDRRRGGSRCCRRALESRGSPRSRRGAEDHIALAGTAIPSPSAPRGPDDQVIDAVAVDVARARDREPLRSSRVDPVEAEAVRAVERRRDRGSPRSRPRCRRRRSSRRRCPSVGIGVRRPDDQVVDAVAVDVPRARDRAAAAVIVVDPVEAEAVRCRRAPRDRGSPRSRRRSRTPHSSRRHRNAVADRRAEPR